MRGAEGPTRHGFIGSGDLRAVTEEREHDMLHTPIAVVLDTSRNFGFI